MRTNKSWRRSCPHRFLVRVIRLSGSVRFDSIALKIDENPNQPFLTHRHAPALGAPRPRIRARVGIRRRFVVVTVTVVRRLGRLGGERRDC